MSDSSQEKSSKTVTVSTRPRASSDDSSSKSSIKVPSLKSPRTARFAEATAVDSPIEPKKGSSPFADPPTTHYMAQLQPSDVGFGYVNRHESVEMPDTDQNDYPTMTSKTPKTPMRSPLKSAMKTPGAPPRELGAIFSPTFKEEEYLEKKEAHTDKEQARDMVCISVPFVSSRRD